MNYFFIKTILGLSPVCSLSIDDIIKIGLFVFVIISIIYTLVMLSNQFDRRQRERDEKSDVVKHPDQYMDAFIDTLRKSVKACSVVNKDFDEICKEYCDCPGKKGTGGKSQQGQGTSPQGQQVPTSSSFQNHDKTNKDGTTGNLNDDSSGSKTTSEKQKNKE